MRGSEGKRRRKGKGEEVRGRERRGREGKGRGK